MKNTFAGPFNTRKEAEQYLNNNPQNSIYSMEEKGAEGYATGNDLFYVENDNTIIHELFGYRPEVLMRMQYK